MKRFALRLLVPMGSAFLACGSSPASPPESARTTGGVIELTPALLQSMRDHAAHGAALRDAVVRADLGVARAEAASLAETPIASGSGPLWRQRAEAMSDAAERVTQAKDLVDASRGVAALATSCGDCHARLSWAKRIVVPERPPPSTGVLPRMDRHKWAMARLWSGLVIPSTETWTAGADVLRDAPLEPEKLTPGKTPGPRIGELARTVEDLGRKAAAASSSADRENAYAELLVTCSECHARLRDSPPPPNP
jgi:mono/diheme cytochrome c family protein